MDAELGRQQTTQGVWMGVAQVDSPEIILVMDVEGTDGRERGEDEVVRTQLFQCIMLMHYRHSNERHHYSL